jgi:hypothetical protein
VANGYFAVLLGGVNPLSAALFDNPTRYLEVRVDSGDGQAVLPRQPLASVPYALQAELAAHAATALNASLAASATQAPWSGLTGVPEGFADGVDDGAVYSAGNQLELEDDSFNVVEGAGSDLDADRLDGQEGDYYRDWNNLSNVPNQPPEAILQADKSVLYLGEDGAVWTYLDLGLSYDPEGGPLSYAFDPTGRGQGLPTDFQTDSRALASFALPGDYLVAGWLRDDAGAVSRAQALVSVYRFGNAVVESDGDVGTYASLAVVNGRPAIAYYDGAPNKNLMYVRANDAAGADWGAPVIVDSAGVVGKFASLAEVDGRPAIAYYDDSPNQDLKYVIASDAAGTRWETPLTVDSAGVVGKFASLAIVDGRPAIAYYDDAPNDNLKYVIAGDAAGTSWETPLTVDSAGVVGKYASLAVVDGRPAIAYYDDAPNYDLKYVRASDTGGAQWGTPVTVDGDGQVGPYASLAVVNGRPAIAYAYRALPYLSYVRALDATGALWGTPGTIGTGPVGSVSLAAVDGLPTVAFNASGILKYVRANDTSERSWRGFVLDGAGVAARHASLAVVDGRPAVAYYDAIHADLRFTIPRQD